MNTTNRAVNRTVLLIVGLVLLGAGGAVATAAAWPAAAQVWSTAGSGARDALEQAAGATVIGGTDITWVAVAAVAALLLVIVVLVVLVAGGVRGRRRTPLRATGAEGDLGRITLTEGFAADALKNALAERDEILTARVMANDVKHQSVLHVSVTPRQNTSPLHVAETVERLVSNLGVLTGQQLTAYISVHSGLRARLAHDQRRLS